VSTTVLILSLLLSSVGLAYLIYGRRQRKATALLSGLALCICPYFIGNIYILIALGIGLLALPFSTEY